MKTILITGSTDGIGKLTAVKLAKDGHYIFLHGRNAEKLKMVIEEIKTETGNLNISGFVADFSDLEDVKKMVKNIETNCNLFLPDSKIDILINNAGVFKTPEHNTSGGRDIRMVVNFLAPVILTNGILPLLQQSDHPRIINLSSAAQAPVTYFSKGTMHLASPISQSEMYAQSKLALTMWSFYFAKKYPQVTSISVNPGSLLNTKMANEAYGQYWSSAEKGVDILYDLAVNPEHEKNSGKYFDNDMGGFNQAHPDCYDEGKVEEVLEIAASL